MADTEAVTQMFLTPRERQIGALLASQSDREIAVSLGLSYHTVRGYMKDLYRKLGVRKRPAAAIAFAHRAAAIAKALELQHEPTHD